VTLPPPGAGTIESASVGDAACFLSFAALERELATLPPTPTHRGRVARIVRRVTGGTREVLDRVELGPGSGIPGDAWGRKAGRDESMQLAIMQLDVATLIANGQPIELFGDNLFLDLDLSNANLPLGSRVRAGAVLLEVTPMPHNGCKNFRARFGEEALRFVQAPALRHRNLRGIYLRALTTGEIAAGDGVEVVSRPDRP
jgi:hypothetical protein